MIANENSPFAKTARAILRIGLNGERRKRAFVAENLKIEPDFVNTMNVLLSA